MSSPRQQAAFADSFHSPSHAKLDITARQTKSKRGTTEVSDGRPRLMRRPPETNTAAAREGCGGRQQQINHTSQKYSGNNLHNKANWLIFAKRI